MAKNNFLDPDGSLGDFWVLNVLRSYADGIIVGANTLAKEPGITCHVYDEDLTRQRREHLGKKHQPVSVVVSFDATDIPFDHYTFDVDPAEELKMVIATGPDGLDYIQKKSPSSTWSTAPSPARRMWTRRSWLPWTGTTTWSPSLSPARAGPPTAM